MYLTLRLYLSLSGSLWLAVRLTLALSGSLWLAHRLSLSPSDSLWLSLALYCSPNLLTKSLLCSQGSRSARSSATALLDFLQVCLLVLLPASYLSAIHRMAKRSKFKGVINAPCKQCWHSALKYIASLFLFNCNNNASLSSSDEILFISTSRKFREIATINRKHNGIASNYNCSSIYGIY